MGSVLFEMTECFLHDFSKAFHKFLFLKMKSHVPVWSALHLFALIHNGLNSPFYDGTHTDWLLWVHTELAFEKCVCVCVCVQGRREYLRRPRQDVPTAPPPPSPRGAGQLINGHTSVFGTPLFMAH